MRLELSLLLKHIQSGLNKKIINDKTEVNLLTKFQVAKQYLTNLHVLLGQDVMQRHLKRQNLPDFSSEKGVWFSFEGLPDKVGLEFDEGLLRGWGAVSKAGKIPGRLARRVGCYQVDSEEEEGGDVGEVNCFFFEQFTGLMGQFLLLRGQFYMK